MKYVVSIEIDVSRDRFIELFDDPENLYKWQKGLKSFQHLSGEPGQPGAKSRLVFQTGKQEMVLIETITLRDLPREFNGTYETNGVFNIVRNRFETVGPNRTRWISENEFQFTTWFMKIIGFLMKGAFPKQSLKYLTDFKAMAETGKDVRNGV